MKILMTTDAVGGVWNYSLTLVRELCAVGHEVLLLCVGPLPHSSQLEAAKCIPRLSLNAFECRLEWMENSDEDVCRSCEWMLYQEKGFKPDLLHVNGFSHVEVPSSAPKICVFHSDVATWFHDVKGMEAPTCYSTYKRQVQKALSTSDAVVFPSEAMRSLARRVYGASSASQVIRNAAPVHRTTGLAKDHLMLAAGRAWDEGKNFQVLADLGSEWPLTIAGEYDRGNPVAGARMLGPLQADELSNLYAKASIFVHPALYEPFGLSVLEAAAAGCALILADIPTLRELWHGAAIFVSPKDPPEWKDEVSRLQKDEERRAQLGSIALSRSSQFSVRTMAEQYLSLYEQLTVARSQSSKRGEGARIA